METSKNISALAGDEPVVLRGSAAHPTVSWSGLSSCDGR